MTCILLYHFILLIISIILLILGMSTSRWLIFINEDNTAIISEHSSGILADCQRFYRQYNNTSVSSNSHINDGAQICYNYLFKWHNGLIDRPELLNYQKALIGISFSCVFVAVISLFLTQLINAEVHHSKRIVNCLLITNILTVILAMITLTLFFGFEHISNLRNCGYSFWLFVIGTCCIFVCCILVAIFRIDVEFEFHRYYHESVVTLC